MKNPIALVAPIIGMLVGIPVGIFVGGRNADETAEQIVSMPNQTAESSCKKYKDMYDSLRIDFIQLQDKAADATTSSHCPQPSKNADSSPIKVAGKGVETNIGVVAKKDPEPDPSKSDDAKPIETGEKKSEQTPAANVNSETEALLANYKNIEKEMGKADSPEKKYKFLDRVRLSSPMQTIDGMKSVTANDKFYEKLFGTFKGTLKFANKERKNGRITLLIRMPPETLDSSDPPDSRIWTVRIDVDDGAGKISRQYGGLDMLRTINDQSNAFFIRSSETSYLQMFYRQSSDQFLGNFYEKNGAGDYPQRATFWLKRKAQ